MIKTILFVIYILMIVTVIFVERKRPTEALLWVLIMVCLPYVGTLLYIVFGNTVTIKLTAFIRKKRLESHEPAVLTREPDFMKKAVISEEDIQVMRFNHTYNQSQVTSYDDARVYITGKSHYEQLFKDIREAEECIFIEFYTIHHDQVGEALVNALAEKASQGVRVLVLCDFIANISTPQKMFRPLINAGGKVIRIKPYLTHYRSHRKVVAIDHNISYIGGMNIGKQYANMAEKKNPWRDTQVRLTGSCTYILEEFFLTDWLCAVKSSGRAETVAYMSSIPVPEHNNYNNLCQFIVSGVDNDKEAAKMCYLSMIKNAKNTIRIQSPYFIPDASILDALKAAAASGVKIELMIPGIKASFFLDPVTTYYAGELLEYGAVVHKYNGYIHAKTMIIDNELCCIGSVNMDIRSLMVDDEICGIFYSNRFVKEYTDLFIKDTENCRTYSLEDFNNRGRKEKIAEGFFLLFAPLM